MPQLTTGGAPDGCVDYRIDSLGTQGCNLAIWLVSPTGIGWRATKFQGQHSTKETFSDWRRGGEACCSSAVSREQIWRDVCAVTCVSLVMIHVLPSLWFVGCQRSMHTLPSFCAARVPLSFGILMTPRNVPWLSRSGISIARPLKLSVVHPVGASQVCIDIHWQEHRHPRLVEPLKGDGYRLFDNPDALLCVGEQLLALQKVIFGWWKQCPIRDLGDRVISGKCCSLEYIRRCQMWRLHLHCTN